MKAPFIPTTIAFGALAAPIHRQVRGKAAPYFRLQLCADAVTLLKVQGFLPDQVAHTIRRRLLREVLSVWRASR